MEISHSLPVSHGVYAVLYAMFDQQGLLCEKLMRCQIQKVLSAGVHGINVLGLATEVNKLSEKEKTWLVSLVAEQIAGQVPLSVTVSGNSVAAQVSLGRHAERSGADWLILQPPNVGKFPASVYLDFFQQVAEQLSIPLAIQNAPAYLDRSLHPDDIEILIEKCSQFSAIKAEVSALQVNDLIEHLGESVTVMNGRGGLEVIDNLRAGCKGFIVAADIADIVTDIYELWMGGQERDAERLYSKSLPAMVFVMQSIEHLIVYGKRLFCNRADMPIYDRAPILDTTAFGIDSVDRFAQHLGKYENNDNA